MIERAREVGVNRILVPGTDLVDSQAACSLAEEYDEVFCAVGVHPNEAKQWVNGFEEQLHMLAQRPKVVAIGEIGLDNYWKTVPPDVQRAILEKQLNLATKTHLPVIIHSRESIEDLLPVLESWQAELRHTKSPLAEHPGVLHSYDGDLASGLKAIEMGFLIGITGPVTFKNGAKQQELVRNLPLEMILIETDSPYLTPHPFRGQRNEPGNVVYILNKIAELHRLDADLVAQQTSQNADRLFAWRAFA